MPADLDDLFSALARRADTLALAPAAEVQRRGARRRRTQAMLAGAAAVLVVTAGVGVAVMRGHPGPRPVPAAPDTPTAPAVRGMTPVGSPIAAGDKNTTWTQTVNADGRLYSAAETPDGSSRVVAIDPQTAKILWKSAPFHPFFDYNGPIAVPGAVLVTDSATIQETPTLNVLDPDTGTRRWKLTWRTPDEVVVGNDVLVRMVAATGVTEAYDLRTGAPLWSSAAGADRPEHVVGMQSGSYDDVANLVGPKITISDDGGLVQVTQSGQVLLRDIRTAALRTTVPAALRDTLLLVAYDGRLFTAHRSTATKQYQINVTDLTRQSGTPRTLYTTTANEPGQGSFAPCGPHRLCLSQFNHALSKSMVAAIDTETGKTLWSAGLQTQVNGYLYARGRRVLRGDIAETGLFDQNGRTVYAGAGDGQWIDDDNVLWMESTKSGYQVSVVAATTGRMTELGTTPNRTGNCSWTSEFLACPVGSTNPFRSEMRIWRFIR